MRNVRRILSITAATTFVGCAWPAHADWLDVVATKIEVRNLRTGQAGENIAAQVGDVLEISCTEYIGLYGDHEKWTAATPQSWENRIKVDSTTLLMFNGSIKQGNGFLTLKKGFQGRTTTYPPAKWTAAGIGVHEASCVLNQPKKISDHVAVNNVIRTPINVTAAEKATVLLLPTQAPAQAAPRATASPTAAVQAPAPASTPVVVEAESLIPTAAVSGGQILRQDMAGFGAGWGGDAQLFWRPPVSAGTKPNLLSEFFVPAAGTYEIVLWYTVAPDFGQFITFVDGLESTGLDGYGPRVALSKAILGRYVLAAGRHELALEVTGKNQRSTGYIVGLDRIHLTPQ